MSDKIPKSMLKDIIMFFISGKIVDNNGRNFCLLRNNKNNIYAECSDIIEIREKIVILDRLNNKQSISPDEASQPHQRKSQ